MKLADINFDAVMRGFHERLEASAHQRILGFLPLCESPIEVMLGAALSLYDKICEPWPRSMGNPLLLAKFEELAHWPQNQRLLIPQYLYRNYRIDWVIREHPHLVFIECDGHDFHERTKQQAAHDRKKDRIIQIDGNPILRFTGSEIHKDAFGCAGQVFDLILKMNTPELGGTDSEAAYAARQLRKKTERQKRAKPSAQMGMPA